MSDPINFQDWFETGKQMFRDGKPRPPNPPEDTGFNSPQDAAWYGWMIERGHRINWINQWVERSNHNKSPVQRSAIKEKAIEALDRQMGLKGKIK